MSIFQWTIAVFGEMVKRAGILIQDARWYFLDKNDGHMFIHGIR